MIHTKLSRRDLMVGAGALIVSQLRISRALASRENAARALVCIQLEGGADGLAWLPPLRDASLHALRPTLATDGALALDSDTGLHPALAALMPFYAQGSLLALTSVGHAQQHESSHRAASLATERALAALPIAAVQHDAAALGLSFTVNGEALGNALARVADSVRAEHSGIVAHVRVPGFDTHVAQASRLSRAFEQLALELAAFSQQLGDDFERTVVLVTTEQGRALRENRMSGTEDGAASAALLLGGAVKGGRVDAAWPALDALDRRGERVLPVRTDLAALIATLGEQLLSSPDRPHDERYIRGGLHHA